MPLSTAVQHRKSRGRRRAQQAQTQRHQRMGQRGQARRAHGVHALEEAELNQPPGHLRRPDQCRNADRRCRCRCHGCADEPGHGQHIGHHGRGLTLLCRRAWRLRACLRLGRGRALLDGGCDAWHQQVQRPRQVQPGPGQAGAAPAGGAVQVGRQRPADRAGKAGEQGDPRDGAPRPRAVPQRSISRPAGRHQHGHRERADDLGHGAVRVPADGIAKDVRQIVRGGSARRWWRCGRAARFSRVEAGRCARWRSTGATRAPRSLGQHLPACSDAGRRGWLATRRLKGSSRLSVVSGTTGLVGWQAAGNCLDSQPFPSQHPDRPKSDPLNKGFTPIRY